MKCTVILFFITIASALPLDVAERDFAYNAPRQLTPKAAWGNLCLRADGNWDGATATWQGCNSGDSAQLWIYDDLHRIRNQATGQCLDATGPSDADGTRLQMFTCYDVPQQRWNYYDNGNLKIQLGRQPCMDVIDHGMWAGNRAQLWTCVMDNTAQTFDFLTPPGGSGVCPAGPPNYPRLPALTEPTWTCKAPVGSISYPGSDYTCLQDASGKDSWVPVKRTQNGQIGCMSTNSWDCIWSSRDCCQGLVNSAASIAGSSLAPFFECGCAHYQVWKISGYLDSTHWCARGWQLLNPGQGVPQLGV
jgi:hypothetical protein